MVDFGSDVAYGKVGGVMSCLKSVRPTLLFDSSSILSCSWLSSYLDIICRLFFLPAEICSSIATNSDLSCSLSLFSFDGSGPPEVQQGRAPPTAADCGRGGVYPGSIVVIAEQGHVFELELFRCSYLHLLINHYLFDHALYVIHSQSIKAVWC